MVFKVLKNKNLDSNNKTKSKIQLKHCPHCDCDLPIDNFSIKLSAKDGRRCYCKKCESELSKKYAKNRAKKLSEKSISKKITNNIVDDIFDVLNLKDIPNNIKKDLHIPKYLLNPKNAGSTGLSSEMRSNIINVLRRLRGREVHLSQISLAYYRVYNELIPGKRLSAYLMTITKTDSNLIRVKKGYYKYKEVYLNGGDLDVKVS